MSRKHKILFALLVSGLPLLFFSTIYTENGFTDLMRLREENNFLTVEISKIGLTLFDEIDIFERLARNDLKLIEHLARQQGMVGKNELIFIPGEPAKEVKKGQPELQDPENFRILTDDEIDKLLRFDIESFKFYDELK